MSTSVKTGAYPDKTPDGKDIVYVAMPSIETTEQYLQAQLSADATNRRIHEIGARIQALAFAKDVVSYNNRGVSETSDERVVQTIEIAARFEAYLLKTEG